MSGPSSRALLVLMLALFAGGLAAQLLPEIGEVEIQGVNLTLLDAKGEKRGTLKGKRASRTRDGKVEITSAELNLTQGDSELKLAFETATYKPGSREIDLPSGLKGVLPDGGALEFAKGKMTLDDERPMSVSATTEGATSLRLGSADNSDFECELQSAAIALAFDASKRVERAAVSGERGAKFNLRMSSVPDWTSVSKEPGRLAATCSGVMRFNYSQTRASFDLTMERRCALVLKGRESGELTADSLALGGTVTDRAAAVTSMRARGNVAITHPQINATAAQAEYAEAPARVLKLIKDVRVKLVRGGSDIECRAADWISLESASPAGAATQIIELQGNARIQGRQTVAAPTGQQKREWVIEGSHCRIASKSTGGQDFEFSGEAQSFAPLLTLTTEIRRVVLRGKSVTGEYVAQILHADVSGPGIIALCDGLPALVPTLRTSLALRDNDATVDAAAVQLVLNAEERLLIDGSLAGADDLRLDATGDVIIDQAPSNPAGRLSASAHECTLAVRRSVLDELSLTPKAGSQVRLSMGADLLQCANLLLAAKGKDYSADMIGPGRLIFRDAASLRYMREAVAELPASLSRQKPDAGWLTFSTEANLRTVADERVIVARDSLLKLVRGDFVTPRSGLDAFNDIAELEAEDVEVSYEARGAAMYATIVMHPQRHSGTTSVRLDGPATVRSSADGLSARAQEGISIQRVHREDRASEPFEVLLTRNAHIEIERAGRFLSDEGGGIFPFTGPWTTSADKLIRLRFTPAPSGVAALNKAITSTLRATLDETRLEAVIAALRADFSRALAAMTPAQRNAFAELETVARAELANASLFARAAVSLRKRKDDAGATQARAFALGALRAAQGSLGPQVDLEAEGKVVAHFEQLPPKVVAAPRDGVTDIFRRRRDAPRQSSGRSLDMTLERVEMSLDGVGTVKTLVARGPVVMSSASYRLEGDRFVRGANGSLILENAKIILSPQSGVAINGLERLEIKPDVRPRMRAVCKKLKLEVSVAANEDAANGK